MRQYGSRPYKVALVHGGPGAPGEMAPVARELAHKWSVLEPFQTVDSLEGQVKELGALLEKPMILVSSGVFDAQAATKIRPTRMARLTTTDQAEIEKLMAQLDDPNVADKDIPLAQIGHLFGKCDSYDPISLETELVRAEYHIFCKVWSKG